MAERLDIVLTNKGYAKSREKAKELIKEGKVYINNAICSKPATLVDDEASIEIRGEVCKYVSRGGYKLEKAIYEFNINLTDLDCMDIGASTGGFTDCMLQNGARQVYSIDVGHDQLDESLLDDERVISIENTNFRYMTPDDLLECVGSLDANPDDEVSKTGSKIPVDFASCDVSFISLKHILPNAYEILSDDGEMVCLIKPQFEAGREHLNKKGVVKDKKIHVKVIREIIDYAEAVGFVVKNLSFSPIKGPEGNTEYLLYLTKNISLGIPIGTCVNPANTVSEAFYE